MAETDIYFWTDRQERHYAVLRKRGGHWQLEWGQRDPPGGPNFLQMGAHQSSVREEMVQHMLSRIRAVGATPDEVAQVEHRLRAAIEGIAREEDEVHRRH